MRAIYHGPVVNGLFPSEISVGKGQDTTVPW